MNRVLPAVGDDGAVSLLESQLNRVVWVIQVKEKQGLPSDHHTDLRTGETDSD